MKRTRFALAVVFFGTLALLPASKAEATCYNCGITIVVDMSGNPVGIAEVCYESNRLLSWTECGFDQSHHCQLSGNTCKYA